MAKEKQPKVTGKAANIPPVSEEQKKVDAAIFGNSDQQLPVDPLTGLPVDAPAVPEGLGKPIETPKPTPVAKMGSEDGGKVTVDRAQFENLLTQLAEVQNFQLSQTRGKDDVFNPLSEVKTDHTVRLAYHGNDLVVGYKATVRPDGREVYTYLRKDPDTGQMRTTVTLLLKDENGDVREEESDFVAFLENAVMLEAKLKERKDIGKVVEQGEVEVMTWDGKRLVGTGTRIMSGAKEQKWLFTVEHKGEIFELPESIVNIK
jgi:hypothetical protein